MKCLKVYELIEELKKYDSELPVVITHGGKSHEYGIHLEEIKEIDIAYFGNDADAYDQFETVSCGDCDENCNECAADNKKYLRLTII